MAERPRVFVSRVLPGGEADKSPIARIRAVAQVEAWTQDDPPPVAVLYERARNADGVLTTLTERIDHAFLDACPRVRVVANMAAGYDNIDLPACTERGIVVTNTPGVLADATADMAFALLLAAARRLPEGERAIRNGEWGPWRPMWMLGQDVHGRTLGIIGPGNIGAAMARRARGFDMRVLYCARGEHPELPGERVSLDELLAQSDFVSFHAPLTPETAGMCDEAFFRKMQPHAIFINTARGGVVDQAALIQALHEGVIGGAGLDVMTPEPLPPDDPLLDAPHIVLAPHVGSATAATRTKMAQVAVDGLLAGLAGERPQHLVNPDALEHRREPAV